MMCEVSARACARSSGAAAAAWRASGDDDGGGDDDDDVCKFACERVRLERSCAVQIARASDAETGEANSEPTHNTTKKKERTDKRAAGWSFMRTSVRVLCAGVHFARVCSCFVTRNGDGDHDEQRDHGHGNQNRHNRRVG